MFHVKQLQKQILPADDLLKKYMELVKKWQKAVNLVSSNELNSLWNRHILDSAQVYFEIPSESRVMVDFGSGGGFPGVVIAILNKVLAGPLNQIILIESDNKKAIFLKEVSRILDLNLIVLNERIENICDVKADVITSRALGKVQLLLDLSKCFYKKNTIFLLLKGESVEDELSEVSYSLKSEKKQSKINETGCILKISEVDY